MCGQHAVAEQPSGATLAALPSGGGKLCCLQWCVWCQASQCSRGLCLAGTPTTCVLAGTTGVAPVRGRRGAELRVVSCLLQVYWYTVEFGVVREGSAIKAFGSGILSSYGELEYMGQVRVPGAGQSRSSPGVLASIDVVTTMDRTAWRTWGAAGTSAGMGVLRRMGVLVPA